MMHGRAVKNDDGGGSVVRESTETGTSSSVYRTDTSVLSLVRVASSTSDIGMQRIYAPLIVFFCQRTNEQKHVERKCVLID